ncbi:hypothetical protein Taro_055502, partial [Colocasia esculenta]|nr:hypothetical protein [Colocasia esculenta]
MVLTHQHRFKGKMCKNVETVSTHVKSVSTRVAVFQKSSLPRSTHSQSRSTLDPVHRTDYLQIWDSRSTHSQSSVSTLPPGQVDTLRKLFHPKLDGCHQQDQEPEPQAVPSQLAIVVFQQKVEQQQESVLEEPPAVATAVEKIQQKQEPQQESRPKSPLESVEDDRSKVKTFKRKVRRKLLKNGEPVFPSQTRPTPSIPTPTAEPPPKTQMPATSQPQLTASSASTPSTTKLPPLSTSIDPLPPTSIPKDQPLATEKLSKNSHHLLDFQLCFAKSERFSLDQWAAAYPADHAACEKMKLSPYEYLSKTYKDLKKNIGPKWQQRYLVYYLAKEAAVSRGLHWNIIVHDFLHLAASRKFVHLKFLLGRRAYHNKLSWYHKRHIKSHRKLPSISPTYNIDVGGVFLLTPLVKGRPCGRQFFCTPV